MNEDQLREEIRKKVKAMGTQKEAARILGFSDQYVNDIVRGRRNISEKFLSAIKCKRVIIYEWENEP